MASKKKVKKSVKKTGKKSAGKKAAPARAAGKSGVMPMADRVLVRPLTPEEAGRATSFGIIIPETVDKEKSEQGIVVAVGPGKRLEDGTLVAVSVAVGDKVLFSKYGFDEVKVGGEEYYIVSEGNILAVLK